MFKITYFQRHPKDGISIGRVFDIIEEELSHTDEVELTNVYMEKPGAKLLRVGKNLLYAYKRRNQEGVNHIAGAVHYLSLALPRRRTVTTLHDLGFIDNKNSNSRPKKLLLNLLLVQTLRRNAYIVCISEMTKEALLRHLSFDVDRIRVIPDPVAQGFRYKPKAFDEQCPVVLHVGTKPNKNLERTIPALKGLPIKLRIVGELTDETKKLLADNAISYTNVWNISDEEIVREYEHCDIVNFPSTFEGFGMPIIEAQAVGRVCVTSCMEPMTSVAGEGAYIVDPFDVSSIRQAYERIIASPELREELIQKGLTNAENYKADKIARQYLDLYREILTANA